MATNTFNAAEMEARRLLLREELAALETEKMRAVGGMQVIDIHHPERSPGWPVYRYQAWPQLLYHSTIKDPLIEQQRLGVLRRNQANPHLAPMDIPESQPVMRKVQNQQERDQALAEGFVETPPAKQLVDTNSPLEAIGKWANNPLSGRVPDVELILRLVRLSKDELLAYPANAAATTDASKEELITAIVAAGVYEPVGEGK